MKKLAYLLLIALNYSIEMYASQQPNNGPDSLKLATTLMVNSLQNLPMSPINLAIKKKDRMRNALNFARVIHNGESGDAVDAYTLKTRVIRPVDQQQFIDEATKSTANYVKRLIDYPITFTQQEFLTAYRRLQKQFNARTHDLYYNIALRKTSQPQE